MTSKEWNLSNHDLFNLNDIRTSARLQKKRELKHEKQLEDLRQQQLLFSQRKSLRRTKKYNHKARRNLIRNGAQTAVLQSEVVKKDLQRIMNNFKDQVSTIVSADDSIAINIDTDKATALGKLATHDVLKMTHLTKTAPIFTFSLPCNSVLSNGAYFAFLLPCNSVLVQRRLDANLT